MTLITGGAYQGKREYAENIIGIKKEDMADGGSCDISSVFEAKCVYGYHKLIRRLMSCKKDPVSFTKKLAEKNRGIIVIIDEVGCGVIPIEREERMWREAVGRCGCILAENSGRVIRLICGIPTELKK